MIQNWFFYSNLLLFFYGKLMCRKDKYYLDFVDKSQLYALKGMERNKMKSKWEFKESNYKCTHSCLTQ